jgi:serine protease AprX
MPRHRTVPPLHRLALGLAATLASSAAFADAQLGHELTQRLATALPGEELEVVITFEREGAVDATELAALRALGIERGVAMRSLPIVGALATPAEIAALAQRDDVGAIHYNAPLRYFNQDARRISGAARAVDNPADFGRALPFSGRGVGVVVHDSGIDATHMDLAFGEHVVENVQGLTNLRALDTMLPITYTEGMANTDVGGSGHGTHVAGTVGGSGERSGGLHRGVAPGADLVGYGSGAAIAILDAVGGFDYAITNQFSFDAPLRVITNSWGSSGTFDPSHPVNLASYEAYKRGMVVLFAAGNDGPGEDTHNPYAQAPWVISVGAGEKDGVLTSFSSRGKRGESASFTMPDGREWTYINQPTVVATGVDIISTRAVTSAVTALAAEQDAAALDPAHVAFYTHMSGTSMATPHVAGIVALMLEANPDLDPLEVKSILEDTATNMSGRLAWEAGAGHVNAYAALAAASGIEDGYGRTVNSLRNFNSNALLVPGGDPVPFSIDFAPVGPVETMSFTVDQDVAWVAARAEIGENTLAIVLTDPDGVRYGSAISLPLLGSTVVAGGPGKPGTWTITVRGIGSVSGTALDPAGVTNGYGLPGTVDGEISFLDSGGYTGLDDIATHPAKGAIQYAVSHRLVDGYSDRKFRPDQQLKRSELAQYLVMGANVRQDLPLDGLPRFTDLSTGAFAYPFAEAAVAAGAPLRDLGQSHDGVMRLYNGAFKPNQGVTRLELAYALVQGLALQDEARAFSGSVTVQYNGSRIALEDNASIPAEMRGYVQLALDQGLINARFGITQGPFDLQPTIRAWFDPGLAVSRAFFAVSAGRYLDQYRLAED